MKKNIIKVVLYCDRENKEKEKLVKKYCKDMRYQIVKVFYSKNDRSLEYWDGGIIDLYNGIIDLSQKHNIDKVITYELEDLDFGLDAQVSICNYLFQIYALVETIKEGSYLYDFSFDYSLETNFDKEEIDFRKKYLTEDDRLNFNCRKED